MLLGLSCPLDGELNFAPLIQWRHCKISYLYLYFATNLIHRPQGWCNFHLEQVVFTEVVWPFCPWAEAPGSKILWTEEYEHLPAAPTAELALLLLSPPHPTLTRSNHDANRSASSYLIGGPEIRSYPPDHRCPVVDLVISLSRWAGVAAVAWVRDDGDGGGGSGAGPGGGEVGRGAAAGAAGEA